MDPLHSRWKLCFSFVGKCSITDMSKGVGLPFTIAERIRQIASECLARACWSERRKADWNGQHGPATAAFHQRRRCCARRDMSLCRSRWRNCWRSRLHRGRWWRLVRRRSLKYGNSWLMSRDDLSLVMPIAFGRHPAKLLWRTAVILQKSVLTKDISHWLLCDAIVSIFLT